MESSSDRPASGGCGFICAVKSTACLAYKSEILMLQLSACLMFNSDAGDKTLCKHHMIITNLVEQ